MQKTKIIALTVTIALVAIVLISGVAFAQPLTPTPMPQTAITPNPINDHTNCPATNDNTYNSNCPQADNSANTNTCPNGATSQSSETTGDHNGMMSGSGGMMNGYGNGNMMGGYNR